MAEDRDKDAPSLEPPSLAPPTLFGRKRKRGEQRPDSAGPAPTQETATVRAEPAPVEQAPAEQTLVTPAEQAPAEQTLVTPAEQAPAEQTLVTPVERAPTEPVRVASRRSPLTPPPAPPAEPGAPREPWLVGRPAAALTGLLVGAVIVAGTAGSLRLCSELGGTSSCGNRGFFLLLAVLALGVVLGSALLRAAAVPHPGSTSFLAVGLLSVGVLIFLVGSIFEWWMAVVIPALAVLTYLLSHWLTTTSSELDDDPAVDAVPGRRDVR